jgi:NAD(P)H-hydrate epimerase
MDETTIADCHVEGRVLMDRAGHGVARGVLDILRCGGNPHPVIRMVAGKGNNGGDVYAAAYHLSQYYQDIEIVLVGDPQQLTGDTLWHYHRVQNHIRCTSIQEASEAEALSWHGRVDVMIEGLLGTGTHGAPREPIASVVRAINRVRDRGALTVSIDLPSGLNADTGEAAGDVVCADYTFTMAYPKKGMLAPAAMPYVGTIGVVDIGIPAELAPAEDAGDVALVACADVLQWLPPRARCSHKGTYGRVLVVGGAPGFSGAVSLAAGAACRSGAGLVHVLTPSSIAERVAQFVPEAMVHAAPGHADGGLSAASLQEVEELATTIDTVLVGPGLTCHPEGKALVEKILGWSVECLVLDADALNLIALSPEIMTRAACHHCVMTPHPGEAARLLGVNTATVQKDRVNAVKELVKRYHATCVLKGAGTLVASEKRCWINMTGNPGMATGGSGDVLAGMLAALAPQTPSLEAASCAAVYIHGVAGDRAARAGSEIGLHAGELLAQLPKAFSIVLGR